MKRYYQILQCIVPAILLLLFLGPGCADTKVSTPMATKPVISMALKETPLLYTVSTSPVPTRDLSTITITGSISPTEKPITSTPEPTLSAGEAQLLVRDMLNNNGSCRFPCIWGLIPGETSIYEATKLLHSFGSISELHFYDTSGGATFELKQNDLTIIFRIAYYYDNSTVDKLESHAMGLRLVGDHTEGAQIFSDSIADPLLNNYTPSQIISEYGLPANILIGGFYDDRGSLSDTEWMLSTVMDYSDLGFIVEYLNHGIGLDESLTGCLSQAWEVTLWSWSGERLRSMEEAISTGLAGGSGGINQLNLNWFQPFEQAISMSLDEFYSNILGTRSTSCYETPVELWEP